MSIIELAELMLTSMGVSIGCFSSLAILFGYFMLMESIHDLWDYIADCFKLNLLLASLLVLVTDLLVIGFLILCNFLMIQHFVLYFLDWFRM